MHEPFNPQTIYGHSYRRCARGHTHDGRTSRKQRENAEKGVSASVSLSLFLSVPSLPATLAQFYVIVVLLVVIRVTKYEVIQ